ncbi:MAG: HEPN domain-containing protein [Candidatus Aminicenantes bacterium]|nr:HEPN domain-containing protein [Candidatus Aminicenantes bacterium]
MPHNLEDLCKYRFEQAQAALESSRTLFNENDLRGSLNRSYYAIFYAARSLLALKQLETRKHSGLVATFIKEYIAGGIFDRELSSIIKNAQRIRVESDYEDFYILSRETTREQVDNAEKFIKEIKKYLESQLNISLD